jgi:DinB superfamily
MPQLPPALDAVARELEAVRAELLQEADGLSQGQADWRPSADDWSVGEIVHHLTLGEIATGKLTSKLLKEGGSAAGPYPPGLAGFAPLPPWPPGPREAPPVVRPEQGHPIGQLLHEMRAARERSRQTLERLAAIDPRALRWRHFAFGDLDLGQWWMLQAHHDRDHLQQLRRIKTSPGFPRA